VQHPDDWAGFVKIAHRGYSSELEALVMKIEVEQEEDGRWLAEVPDLPGVMGYGETEKAAVSKVKALALRVLADRLEHGEEIPELTELFAMSA
jgi:predicted RNase H-like HicB family nuclease